MDFIGFNKAFRELENASWRPTMFEDLQVCYCEEGLYALRCKHGTSNEHICLIREESEDAAIARAVFDLHKRGDREITVRTDNSAVIAELQRRLKVAEAALEKSPCGEVDQLGLSDGDCYNWISVKFDEEEGLKLPLVGHGDRFVVVPCSAIAAIREKGGEK